MNKFEGIGNLISSPKLKRAKNGADICKFQIALPRGKTKDGVFAGYDFITVCTFGDLARECYDTLSETDLVAVDGKIHSSQVNIQGLNLLYFEVSVNNIEFIQTRKEIKKERINYLDKELANSFFEKIEDIN